MIIISNNGIDFTSIVSNIISALSVILSIIALRKSMKSRKEDQYNDRYTFVYNPLVLETFICIKDKNNSSIKGNITIYKYKNVWRWKGYILGEHIKSQQSNFEFKIQAIDDIKDIYDIEI